MRYKVLRYYYRDGNGSGVFVEDGMEEWDSLAAALNDLGPSGWEVATPPYETDIDTDRGISKTKSFGLILLNRDAATEQERKKQADNIRRQLVKLEAKLANPGAVDTRSQEETISRFKEEIQRLLGVGSESE